MILKLIFFTSVFMLLITLQEFDYITYRLMAAAIALLLVKIIL